MQDKNYFEIIDTNTWNRKEYFELYSKQMKCTYSLTCNIDISSLISYTKQHKVKLYPTLIYFLTKTVNKHSEFRISLNSNNQLGIWAYMNPCYTIFNKESETFSQIWTQWDEDLGIFISNYNQDFEKFSGVQCLNPKPNTPQNVFPISSLPWINFTSFNLNIESKTDYFLPIFTWGKYTNNSNKTIIPLAIQVHHALCDGFHVSRFIEDLQNEINSLK